MVSRTLKLLEGKNPHTEALSRCSHYGGALRLEEVCTRPEPCTECTISERIRQLLSRRPDSSRTRRGYTRRSNCGLGVSEWAQGHLVAATRWTASPLRSSRLNRTAFCGVAPDIQGTAPCGIGDFPSGNVAGTTKFPFVTNRTTRQCARATLTQ